MKAQYANRSVDTLRGLAAEKGIKITEYADDLQRAREEAIEAIPLPRPPVEDKERSAWYRFAADAMRSLMELASLLQMLVIHGIAAPLLAVVIGIVEFDRVRLGITQFDPDHAAGIAAAVILAYVVGIMVEAHYTYVVGQEETTKERGSLRKTFSSIWYFLGLPMIQNRRLCWSPRYISNKDTLAEMNLLVQLAVVIAASFGSLQSEFLTNETTPWYQRTLEIFTDSNFRTFMGVVVMGLIAWMGLRVLHWSLYRVHQTVIGLVGNIELGGSGFLSDYADAQQRRLKAANQAEKMRLIEILIAHESPQENPLSLPSVPIPLPNGNGNHLNN